MNLPSMLDAAITAEKAQSVEPVALVTVQGGKCTYTRSSDFRKVPDGDYELFTQPVPPASGERAKFVTDLRSACIDGTLHATLVNKAADMLEADGELAFEQQKHIACMERSLVDHEYDGIHRKN